MTTAVPHPPDQASPEKIAPTWFTSALAAPVDARTVSVKGARIAYRAYGPEGRPGMVLVHGGAAHARWWDHIAPMLAQDQRIAALDLSGHGDSDWRANYDLDTWALEAMTVASDAGIAGRPVIIGHSMGGFVTWAAASGHGASLAGAITIDSPVYDLSPEQVVARGKRATGHGRAYPSRDAALAGFRPVPAQAVVLPYVREHLARTSIRQHSTGWGWKYDRRVFASPRMSWSVLKPFECPVALIRCTDGMVSPSMSDAILARIESTASAIALHAGHHVMLDQPLALTAALKAVLEGWRDPAWRSAANAQL